MSRKKKETKKMRMIEKKNECLKENRIRINSNRYHNERNVISSGSIKAK